MPLKLPIKIQNTVSIRKYAFSDIVEICCRHYMDCIIHERFTESHCFKVIQHVNLTSIFSKAYSTATQSLKSLLIPKNSIHVYKLISHDPTPQTP